MRFLGSLMGLAAASLSVGQTIVAFGDSLTDEYFQDGYGYAKSWYEQIHALRAPIGGPIAPSEEPRRGGMVHNWSRFGHQSGAMVDVVRKNLNTIAAQKPRLATIFVGQNDLSPWSGRFPQLYSGDLAGRERDAFLDGVATNIRDAGRLLKGRGIPVVLASPVDLTSLPFARGKDYVDPVRAMRVHVAFGLLRDRLRAIARADGWVFVDLFALTTDVFGTPAQPKTRLTVAGNPIRIRENGEAPTNGYVADGIHPHSVIQSLYANTFLAAFRRMGLKWPPLTEREMAQMAGLPYRGTSLRIEFGSYVTG